MKWLLAVLLFVALLPASLHAQEPGYIAFISDRDGNPELYLIAADGSGLTRLTFTPLADGDAAWSPDGTMLVFTTETTSGSELVVLDVASGASQQITSLGAMISHPVWSPDGSFIAFAANPSGNNDIHTIAPDGLDLANWTNDPASDTWPTWSPDGLKLAFQSDRDGDLELYQLDLTSADVTRLTDSPGPDQYPIWSPADNRILFISERNRNADIFVIDLEGNELLQLSDTPFDDTSPVWSPDGDLIVYIGSPKVNTTELFTVNADGTNSRQRTTDGMKAADPGWSPDGEWITYASNRGGGYDIYALHAGGEGWIALTDLPTSDETRPLWGSFVPSVAALPTPTVAPTLTPQATAEPPTPSATLPPTLPPSPTSTATSAPLPTQTPLPAPDLLLIYDANVPWFELINVSPHSLNLTGLRFEGNGHTVDGSLWEQSNPSLILEWFQNGACLGLWALGITEPPLPAECSTRLAWWSSDNALFWTGGTFTVSYYDVPVAVCKSVDGRCPINLSAGTSDDTATPSGKIPTPVDGSGDVLLIYDPAAPSLYLINVSERLLDLTPLRFTGNEVVVDASIWQEAGMSSDLSSFDSRGCLGLWGLSIEQAPVPLACRFRHGWWTSDEIVFWTGDTFTVLYGDNPLAVCETNAGNCMFNLPEG